MPNHTEWLPNTNPITRFFLARDGTQSSVTGNHYGHDFNFHPRSRSLIHFLSDLVFPSRCLSCSLFLGVTGPVLYALPCLGSEQRQAFTKLLSISISKGRRRRSCDPPALGWVSPKYQVIFSAWLNKAKWIYVQRSFLACQVASHLIADLLVNPLWVWEWSMNCIGPGEIDCCVVVTNYQLKSACQHAATYKCQPPPLKQQKNDLDLVRCSFFPLVIIVRTFTNEQLTSFHYRGMWGRKQKQSV